VRRSPWPHFRLGRCARGCSRPLACLEATFSREHENAALWPRPRGSTTKSPPSGRLRRSVARGVVPVGGADRRRGAWSRQSLPLPQPARIPASLGACVFVEFPTVEDANAYAAWAEAPERRKLFAAAGVIAPLRSVHRRATRPDARLALGRAGAELRTGEPHGPHRQEQQRSAEWYQRVLGFKFVKEFEERFPAQAPSEREPARQREPLPGVDCL
jgi:hypothetical protein